MTASVCPFPTLGSTLGALPEPRNPAPPSAIRRAAGDGFGGRQDPLGGTRQVVSLALGEPSWELPEAGRRALASIRFAPYGPRAGDDGLKQAVSRLEGVQPDRVLITTGAQGALHALVRTFLGAGDSALIPDPGFPAYAALVRMVGADPVPYSLPAESGFRLAPTAVEEAFRRSPGARMVFLCHPSNPTGAGASRQALRRISALCAERGALLVSDEVYRHLHAEERDTPAGLLAAAGEAETSVVVGSVSKAWGAPGLRVGWLVAAPRVARACSATHAWAATCAPHPCQHSARALLEASEEILPRARRDLASRWSALESTWRAAGGEPPEPPSGGIYTFAQLPEHALADPLGFCASLRQRHGVAVVPGLAFGEGGRAWARLAFAGPTEDIREGVRRWVMGLSDTGLGVRAEGGSK